MFSVFVALGAAAVAGAVAVHLYRSAQDLKRAEFIRTANWPPGLFERVQKHHPQLTRKDLALIGNGLRQFFLAYLKSGRRYVAMPSEAADQLWHEFILYTRDYDRFCEQAFGKKLHHTPAVALAPEQRASNEGLRRVWTLCCKEENIDPRNPTRLPLLFALDRKLKFPGGYHYEAKCEALRARGVPTQCGGDFSSTSIDGGSDGFGASADGSSEGGGDGGGGDGGGGGCGGGGGD